jgi:hypothetical protein
MMPFINTYDVEALKAEFAKLPAPKRTAVLKFVDASLESVPESVLGGFKLNPLRRWVKRFTDERELRAAAWKWLKPTETPAGPEKLVDLQKKAELAHLPHPEFCRRLLDACASYAEIAPPLVRHVQRRSAEIEFKLADGVVGEEFVSHLELFQRALLRATLLSNPANAVALANTVLTQVLAAAAAAIGAVLDERQGEGCVINANLMIPIRGGTGVDDVMPNLGELADRPGAKSAAWLWNSMSGHVHQVFVVVAESKGEEHLGFWVPDVRTGGKLIPGAPRAFYSGTGDAVFVDDLAQLPCDDEIGARWRKYMSGSNPDNFSGRMFVSIPVMSRLVLESASPVAIVNVNVNSTDDHVWRRAYSRAWLERATKLVSPWVATAWHAYGIAFELGDKRPGLAPPLHHAFGEAATTPLPPDGRAVLEEPSRE